MEKMNDRLYLSFNSDKKNVFNSSMMGLVLENLDMILPVKPDYIIRSSHKPCKIQRYSSSIALKALDKYRDVIEIFDEARNVSITIMQDVGRRSGFGIWLKVDLISKMQTTDIKHLFLNIASNIPMIYADGHFQKNGDELYNNVYDKIGRRTYFAAGLYWLNFFGTEEEAKQGGKALENNPYATEVKRMANGLFIQVGESPFDCYTETGRELLINATNAMPPATGW
jgi:hypothetical protein